VNELDRAALIWSHAPLLGEHLGNRFDIQLCLILPIVKSIPKLLDNILHLWDGDFLFALDLADDFFGYQLADEVALENLCELF
jgi:hypothetical protein